MTDGQTPAVEAQSVKPVPTESGEKTAEQQMADFEEALKNEDWGHQPC